MGYKVEYKVFEYIKMRTCFKLTYETDLQTDPNIQL